MRKRMYAVVFTALAGVASCAKQPEAVAPLTLLGLTEQEVIAKLGEPDRKTTAREGLEELMYEDIRFGVMLENGIAMACILRDASSVALNERIRCGVPMAEVLAVYGAYTSEAEVAADLTSDQYVQGVLYHHWLSSDTERYHLRYPDKQLLFTFYPNKSLHSVWIGKTY